MAGLGDWFGQPGVSPEQNEWLKRQMLMSGFAELLKNSAPTTDPRAANSGFQVGSALQAGLGARNTGLAGLLAGEQQQKLMADRQKQKKLNDALSGVSTTEPAQVENLPMSETGPLAPGTTVQRPRDLASLTQDYTRALMTSGEPLEAAKMYSAMETVGQKTNQPLIKSDKIQSVMAELGFNINDPKSYTPENMAKVNRIILDRDIEVAGAKATTTTQATNEANKDKPLSPFELEQYVKPDTLEPFPAGATLRNIERAGGFAINPKVRDKIFQLDNTASIVDTLDTLTKQIITAEGPGDAAMQAAKLHAGAISKVIPAATAYADFKSSFTGVISRTMGGEKGVLTDRDIERIVKGLPQFGDTKNIRDFKIGVIQNLLETAKDAQKKVAMGGSADSQSKQKIQGLVDQLSGNTTPTAKTESAMPKTPQEAQTSGWKYITKNGKSGWVSPDGQHVLPAR